MKKKEKANLEYKNIKDVDFNQLPDDVKSKLQDLSESLKELTRDLDGWCYKYWDQSILGEAIYEDFINYNKASNNGTEDRFIFSDDFSEVGILSQLEGFQFIAMLVESFGLDPQKYGDKIKKLLRQILDEVTDEKGNLHLDASPYLKGSKQFDDGSHYLDTMTWFMSMVCSVIRLDKKDNGFSIEKDLEDKMVKLFVQCMEYLTSNFIDGQGDNSKFSYGWNFTGSPDIKHPSLYFTFAVSEVLIDIFKTFEATIRGYETKYVQKEIDRVFADRDDVDEETIIAKKQQIEEKNDEFINGVPLQEREAEKNWFLRLNNGKKAFAEENEPKTLYQLLEAECKDAANNLWALVKDKLTEEFFAPNVISTVSGETIEQSITSDALFNNIFIINILMNAGLDEDEEDKINYFTINPSDEYDAALESYDDMRDAMRLGYERVYRMYTKMKKLKKEYKINDYTLSFTEDFEGDSILRAQELRRAHIRVFSLMPLLVKTKTTMSDFVIKYPQFDMQIYLETILDNRLDGADGKKQWIWEQDGYSTSSNYYFLSALNDFYGYYNEYELKYSVNAYDNDQAKKDIKKEHEKQLELPPEGKIYLLREELKDAKAANDALQEENNKLAAENQEHKDNLLYKALNQFIEKAVQERITGMISGLFTNMAEKISDDGKNRSKGRHAGKEVQEKDNFESSLRLLLFALMKEDMVDVLFDKAKVNDENVDKKMVAMEDRTRRDLKRLLQIYLYQVFLGGDGDGGSDFVSTEGYSGIKDALKKFEAEKADASKDKKN